MKQVWILKEPVDGLDDQNEALKQYLRRNGMVVRVVDVVPTVEMDAGDVLLVQSWRPEVFDVARRRDSGEPIKVAAYMREPSVNDAVYNAAIGYPSVPWRDGFEEAIFAALDLIAFPTAHLHNLADPDTKFAGTLVVGGFSADRAKGAKDVVPWGDRKFRVVNPFGGLASDAVQEFEALRAAYTKVYPDDDVEWVSAYGRVQTREDLLKEYGKARVVFSSKMSETWPNDLLTASRLGAYPLAPNRLCYPEIFTTPGMLYTEGEQVEKLHALLHMEERCPGLMPAAPHDLAKALEAI